MDGKTHSVGAVQCFSLFVFLLWALTDQTLGIAEYVLFGGFWGTWLLFDQIRIGAENKWEDLRGVEESEEKRARLKKSQRRFQSAAYLMALGSVVFLIAAVDLKIFENNGIIGLGYLLAFLGGTLPDLDSWFSVKYHRDPFTHSVLLPSLFFIYFFLGLDNSESGILFVCSGLLIGYSSHLLFDVYPRGSSIFKVIKRTFSAEEGAPGDIRHLPEVFERGYLTLGGFAGLGYSIALIIRIGAEGTSVGDTWWAWWDFSPAWEGWAPAAILFGSLALGLSLVSLVLLLGNWDKKKPTGRWCTFFLRNK